MKDSLAMVIAMGVASVSGMAVTLIICLLIGAF